MRMRALVAAWLVVCASLGTPPMAAAAVGDVRVQAVDYQGGTVVLVGSHDSQTAVVTLSDGSSTVSTGTALPGSSETTLPPYALRRVATLTIRGLDPSGGVLWETAVRLDPANYRPQKPAIGVAWGKIVASRWTFTGGARRPLSIVRARVRETGRVTTIRPWPGNKGAFTFRGLAVPYGQATIDVTARNGFGSSPRRTLRVYQLGSNLPTASRYELVCKRTLWMFDVSRGRVIHAWPIAIGTPQTPTPRGSFRIGRPMPASGPWGVLRRRLTRVGGGPTRFYIHGTNEPWSIGMQASHGCIRMYNYQVRQFARVVPNNTLVRIR